MVTTAALPGLSVDPRRLSVCHFVIPGPPVAAGRPRMTRNGHVYTPEKTTTYRSLVALAARDAWEGQPRLSGPIYAQVLCYLPRPKKYDTRTWPGHALPAMVKPDCDNLAKAVLDACNGIVYGDDKQVIYLSVSKLYHERGGLPRVEVVIATATSTEDSDGQRREEARRALDGADQGRSPEDQRKVSQE